jgi:molecular chaperone DnaK (HSP70)
MKETIIGIDLGTSNCCISYIDENGKIEILYDHEYPLNPTIPSIISIESDGILVGNEIDKSHISLNKNIFHSFKRLIGHKLDDLETSNLKQILNYDIIELNGKILCVDSNSKQYHLEEIIYLLLSKIKTIIINKFGGYGWSCIVTIPAYFNEIQRQITLTAIQLAELPLIKLLNEPTAASFAYLYYNKILYQETFNKKILVIDFGAGTLDLTIVEMEKGEDLICEVLGIYGDNNFGGIDVTKLVYNTIFTDIDLYSIDINTKLRIADDIKIELSNQFDVKYYSNELAKTFKYKYKKFCLQLEKEFAEKMIFTINQVLDSAKLEKNAIDEIVLVGGSFKIPYFRTLVSNYFNKQIDKVSLKINSQTFLLYEDIAVSLGASAYGYFNSRSDNIVLIEKLPLSIGIETANGQIIKIIERNTPIPITKTKTFTTEDSIEKSVDITVFQGESIFKDGCVFIGKFTLINLPPNKPIIFVSIRVDSNGIISVSARDKRGFTESGIQIETSSSKLSEQTITDLLAKYEQTKKSEVQYKNLISNYYQLITLIDKISYQINFILDLKLEPEVIQRIRLDLEKVLDAMSNPYIISRYRINTNLLKKCAIINDISSGLIKCEPIFEMSLEEISNYIDMLIKLREYLSDRYDIFIIQETNVVLAQEQIDEDTATNYVEIFDSPNTKKTSCSSIKDLDNLKPIYLSENKIPEQIEIQIYTKTDYDNLVDYLRLNIKDFELTEFGEKYLLEKINQISLNIDNTNTIIYENLINLINELCEYTKTYFSD